MSGQHCENYDVKRETVHCYPRNVDRCCWNLSALFKLKFAFVLFCYITNHLMTGPLGNSEFCFPRISMFLGILGKQNSLFPSGPVIKCLILPFADDPCEDSLCLNGGTCIVSQEEDSQFKCNCKAGFTGTRCEGTETSKTGHTRPAIFPVLVIVRFRAP